MIVFVSNRRYLLKACKTFLLDCVYQEHSTELYFLTHFLFNLFTFIKQFYVTWFSINKLVINKRGIYAKE